MIFKDVSSTFDLIYQCLMKFETKRVKPMISIYNERRLIRIDGAQYYVYEKELYQQGSRVDMDVLYTVFDELPLDVVRDELCKMIASHDIKQVISNRSSVKLKFGSGQTLIVARCNLKNISQLYVDLDDEFCKNDSSNKISEMNIPLHVDDITIRNLDEIIRHRKIKIKDLAVVEVLDYLGIFIN